MAALTTTYPSLYCYNSDNRTPYKPYTVYNISVLYEPDVNRQAAEVSKRLGKAGLSEFVLGYPPYNRTRNSGKPIPHATLYMIYAERNQNTAQAIQGAVAEIAKTQTPFEMTADKYLLGDKDRMFEIKYRRSMEFLNLQAQIVRETKQYRAKDASGKYLYAPHTPPGEERTAKWLENLPGPIRQNMLDCGYEEFGEEGLREHITLGKVPENQMSGFDIHTLQENGTLPAPEAFNGKATELGVFEMGPNGTCVREIARIRLGQQAALRFGQAAAKAAYEKNPFATASVFSSSNRNAA